MARVYSVRQWLDELDDLALAASQAEPDSEHSCLETMLMLLESCPDHYRLLVSADPSGQRIAAQRLAGEACESAALALLPGQAGIMTSRGANGTHFASILLERAPGESTSVGSTFALAVLSAYALSIVEVVQPSASLPY